MWTPSFVRIHSTRETFKGTRQRAVKVDGTRYVRCDRRCTGDSFESHRGDRGFGNMDDKEEPWDKRAYERFKQRSEVETETSLQWRISGD